ncbi:hypothetical protein B0A49_10868, partial [Cryomyces minteri]
VGVESLPMIKLADFGFARVLPTTSLAETLCGSPLYMAPEILRYERYDAKADLWSVGTVVYEMIAGKPPFRASNHVELLRKIEKGNDQIAFPDGAILSRDLKKLIRALLKKHPTERISFENFFSSSVIVGEIPGLWEPLLPITKRPSSFEHTSSRNARNSAFVRRAGSWRSTKATLRRPQVYRSRTDCADSFKYAAADEPKGTPTESDIACDSTWTPGAASRAITSSGGRCYGKAYQSQQPITQLFRHTGSYDKRLGLSPTTATAALSKAINMASLRVFGIGASPPLGKGPSPPQGYGAFPTYPTTQGSPLMIGDGSKNLASVDEDTRILHTIEEAAHRSDVVFGFAEVKYKQLLPATPSNEHGLGVRRCSVTDKSQSEDTSEDDDLTVDAIVAISEEALVLYVKALAILAKAIDLVGSWWGQRNRGEILGESASPRDTTKSSAPPIGNRMNNVVQWARNRFNECLEKSEFVGRKLVDAQKQLPLDNPGHPSNHPSASTSSTSVGTSAENINLTSGVTAEKLMYDRAVEMSRAAAVNELVGEDLAGCELNYNTAAKLLEAVLESDDEPLPRRSNGTKKDKKADDEIINGMETEDRQSVVKLIEGTKTRLAALKKKIAVQREQQAAKRTSVTNVVPSRTTTKASPVQTPLTATTPPK